MNTSARIERARHELERLKREAFSAETAAARFGPNCLQCRHSNIDGSQCRHPALQRVSVAWNGAVEVEGEKSTRDMRHESGMCGPEAALFDARQWYRRMPWFAVAGAAWCVPWIYVAATIEFGGPFLVMCIVGIIGPILEYAGGRWS